MGGWEDGGMHTAEIGITQKELDLLTVLAKSKTLTEASEHIRIRKSTASQRMRRLKDRYLKAREFCEDYERWRGKLPGRYL